MSKSKKRKKQVQLSAAEKEALRQEKAEAVAKQNRRALLLVGGLVVLAVLLIAMIIAPLNIGKPDGYIFSQYQRLESGMTYERVTKILGAEGKEISTNDEEDSYIWENETATTSTVTFKDDTVSSFNQKGLDSCTSL